MPVFSRSLVPQQGVAPGYCPNSGSNIFSNKWRTRARSLFEPPCSGALPFAQTQVSNPETKLLRRPFQAAVPAAPGTGGNITGGLPPPKEMHGSGGEPAAVLRAGEPRLGEPNASPSQVKGKAPPLQRDSVAEEARKAAPSRVGDSATLGQPLPYEGFGTSGVRIRSAPSAFR